MARCRWRAEFRRRGRDDHEEIAGSAKVTLWACKPCVEARGLAATSLDRRVKLGGMNDFHAAAKSPDAKVVSF